MRILSIDIETYSSVDLVKSGVYPYTEAPDFEILLFAYAWDDGPVEVIDLTEVEDLPEDVMNALTDPSVIKTAFNANFERTCIAKHFDIECDPAQWQCTAVHAAYLGLPGNLDGVAKCLKLEAQKDTKGKNLIKYFSVPCKPTKANGGRTRNLPHHDPEKWQQFIEYNRQDVEVERAIRKKLERYPVPEFEHRLWCLDQKIVDRGVMLDAELVEQAIKGNTAFHKQREDEAKALTGLENPNSVAQLKKWLEDEHNVNVTSLSKDNVAALIEQTENEDVKRVLRLRQEMSKTSVKKYQAMQRVRCQDGRARGLIQFYGANRTGRWAGRLVQVQNLPRNYLPDLALARELVRSGDHETLEMLYDNIPDVLSQLIRTAFIPSPGHRLIVSDFSAIEARVIAWLAGEKWRLDVFNSHGKIYEASASQMFGVPIEQITKGSDLRQRGKVAELALGYQGGVGALKQMGALDMGLTEEELPELVQTWRGANPNIVQFWYDVERAALTAVREKRKVPLHHGISFLYEAGMMRIKLPSGRHLTYVRPKIGKNKFGKDAISYEGVGDQGKWMRLDTYGGKLVENIVQAVARDCLAVAMMRVADAGYPIVMHVHDELVVDAPHGFGSLTEVETIMSRPIEWAPDLPLKAEGFETDFYMKD